MNGSLVTKRVQIGVEPELEVAKRIVHAALQEARMPRPIEHLQSTRGQRVAYGLFRLGVRREDASEQIAGQYRKKVAVDARYRFDYVSDRGVCKGSDDIELGSVRGGQFGGR